MSEQPSIITDELRAAVGVESAPCEVEIERSAIGKYAAAIQDPNPIYFDAAFAKRTPHGAIIAPPTFLCALELDSAELDIPIPATHTEQLNGGVEYIYERPIRVHEVLIATRRLAAVSEADGRLGRMLFLNNEIAFHDSDGKLVAQQISTGIRYPRPKEDQRQKQAAAAAPPAPADDRDVAGPQQIDVEQRLRPRYFEDVVAGEQLPPLPKKPLLRHLVMYAGASGNFLEYHYDPEVARALGMPGLILHGNLKVAYLGQIVTDWIGAHGTVLKLVAQLRGMDRLGDVCLVQGKVTRVFRQDGRGLAELELWGEAPGGRKTMTGSAVLALPCRESH